MLIPDDLIYLGASLKMVEEYKKNIVQGFEMSDLRLMRYFLGIQVNQSEGEDFISQEKYVDDLLKKFHMENFILVETPWVMNEKLQQDDIVEKMDSNVYRNLVGSLVYLTNTRHDIVHSVSYVSRFMSEPS